MDLTTRKKEYFLYRHIRLDTNEVFYVGIGTKPSDYKTYKYEFSRAFSKTKRTSFWKNIIAKTEYKVEILFESFSEDEILKKEDEFVNLYGRRDLNQGSLVNLKNGGRANLNPNKEMYVRAYNTKVKNGNNKVSEETRQKISKAKKGNSPALKGEAHPNFGKTFPNRHLCHSEESKKKRSISRTGIYHTEEAKKKMSENKKGITKTEEHKLKIALSNKGQKRSEETCRRISEAKKGKPQTKKRPPFTEEQKKRMREIGRLHVFTQEEKDKLGKIIEQYSKEGQFIQEWITISKAAKHFNTTVANISLVLTGKNKSACGFIWKYKNQ